MAHWETLHPGPHSGTPVTAQWYQTMALADCLSRHSCQCTNFGTASPHLPPPLPTTDQVTVFYEFYRIVYELYRIFQKSHQNSIKCPGEGGVIRRITPILGSLRPRPSPSYSPGPTYEFPTITSRLLFINKTDLRLSTPAHQP